MAGSMNRVTLVGNVGKDPESRSFGNGGKVVNLSIATSESWKDKQSGERKEKTEWHTVAVFTEGLVGIVERYVSKGSKLLIEGKLQTRKWQDQQGNDRYSTEVVLQGPDARILLLDGGKGSDTGQQRGSTQRDAGTRQSSPKSNQGGGFNYGDDLNDEVPF
ncbi:single-stranded DNA-binding protein [Sphingomonas sp. SAFR-052]|uniref:single-stranded DNA-binding protein n=1 Tax=Sphingomonas sp. SAFR-052 TaxID=3436867 RepID=UPI003F7F6FBB